MKYSEEMDAIRDAISQIQEDNNRIKVDLSNIWDSLQILKNDIYDLATG